jgi:glycine/D-amino acid oxidase-like deaminating enzyme
MTATETDVAIIGGGIVGMTAALDLVREGKGVVIIDDGRHSGTTANAGSLHAQMQSRFIRMYPDLVPNLEASLPLYPAGIARWDELASELGSELGIKMTGGLMVAEDEGQFTFLAEKCARERRLGLECHMVDRAELSRIAPYLSSAVFGAEFCGNEGKVDPLLANEAIRRALVASGVTMRSGRWVDGIRMEGSAVVVTTTSGVVRAGQAIIAAGAGTGALTASLGLPIPTVAEPLHVNITEPTGPLIGHLVQHADRMITMKQLGAGQVVIGGGWPAHFEGPDAFPTVELDSVIGNLSLAQHIIPAVRDLRLLRTWAGVNTTADGQCILGRLPDTAQVIVAVPGDAGYTLGPLVGHMAAALAGGRDPGFDIARFTPQRFSSSYRERDV